MKERKKQQHSYFGKYVLKFCKVITSLITKHIIFWHNTGPRVYFDLYALDFKKYFSTKILSNAKKSNLEYCYWLNFLVTCTIFAWIKGTQFKGTRQGTHSDTGITPGQLGKLLKPRSGDYLGRHKATVRDKLLLVEVHIQRTQRASTSISTPHQIQCTQLTLAYSINPEWGLACHGMGSLLGTSIDHANSQTRTALKAPGGHASKY